MDYFPHRWANHCKTIFTIISVDLAQYDIGVGRCRILGGGGGKGGPNSQQAHAVVTTSMRRNDAT